MSNEKHPVVREIAKAIERLTLAGIPDVVSFWLIMGANRKPDMGVVAAVLDEAAPWIPTHVVIEPDGDGSSFLITPVKCVNEDDVVELCYTSSEWARGVDEPKWTVHAPDDLLCYKGWPGDEAAIVDLHYLFGPIDEAD